MARPFFDLHEAFNSLDINRDGRITFDELKRLIESRGFVVNQKDLTHVIDKMDKKGDRTISYEEFKQEMLPRSPN